MSGPDPSRPNQGGPDPSRPDPSRRSATVKRATKETSVSVRIDLDGSGEAEISTGLPFFDHMLAQLARHGLMELEVEAEGDLAVDAHHTVEDTGIVLGEALREALGDKSGLRRFGSVAVPLDEALVEVALDLSGRPYLAYSVGLPADASPLGSPGLEPQLAEEFWRAFAVSAGVTLHVRSLAGRNTHHLLEASFKAVALALRDALRREGTGVPSTKGALA
ncbi:MAG: imidazoleglycerol-phosphate dehydratase HisB [Actinomycetota bacterium]|nr:imidazoleglycerol-phosphate dehydratase HisB [Actinomycetota bacterium]